MVVINVPCESVSLVGSVLALQLTPNTRIEVDLLQMSAQTVEQLSAALVRVASGKP